MAALTSGSWTIKLRDGSGLGTASGGQSVYENIIGKKRMVQLKLTLAASGNVSAAGIVMPGAGSVAMRRNLDYYTIEEHTGASGHVWKYSVSGNSIRAYTAAISLAGTVGLASGVANEINLATGKTKLGVSGAALTISGSQTGGPRLKQLATNINIGAQTFYVTAYGW